MELESMHTYETSDGIKFYWDWFNNRTYINDINFNGYNIDDGAQFKELLKRVFPNENFEDYRKIQWELKECVDKYTIDESTSKNLCRHLTIPICVNKEEAEEIIKQNPGIYRIQDFHFLKVISIIHPEPWNNRLRMLGDFVGLSNFYGIKNIFDRFGLYYHLKLEERQKWREEFYVEVDEGDDFSEEETIHIIPPLPSKIDRALTHLLLNTELVKREI